MKRIMLTAVIVIGMTICATAQNHGGGLFQKGNTNAPSGGTSRPALPVHGSTQNEAAPIGSGVLLLLGFGTAYAMSKRKK